MSVTSRPIGIKMSRRHLLAGITGAAFGACGTSKAQDSVQSFYRGKTIRVISPFGDASLYTSWTKVIVDYLPQYLPGAPSGWAQSVPGGGGLHGANYLYNAAPRDGTSIGVLYDNMPTEQALKTSDLIKFDARRFGVLGSLNQRETGVVAIMKRAGVASVDDARNWSIVLAATGTSSAQFVVPNAMNKLLGTRFNIIPGYRIIQDAMLAIETGEADGIFTNFTTLVQQRPHWIENKSFAFIAQLADIHDPAFSDVPLLQDVATDPLAKESFRFLAWSRAAGKIFAAPPDVPAERLEALRNAFSMCLKNPGLVERMAKFNIDIDPRSHEETLAIIRATVEVDAAVLVRVREILEVK